MNGRVGSRHRRRAVDSMVATVLTVVVALAASIAASGFVFGVMGRAQDPGRVAVTGTVLLANYFTAHGNTSTFTCASSASGAYLILTDFGTGTVTVTGVSITWADGITAYLPSGGCDVGASGSTNSTQYLLFPATTTLNVDAATALTYTGTVTLSTGAQLLFTGTWL